jgi:DNA-binding transcriptional LysR family regulator
MSFNRLDLNLLRIFDAVYATRSVTEAAASLNMTQPAVSKQLNRLRESLDDPLFVRISDGMAPTPYADALSAPIRDAIGRIRDAVERQYGFDPAKSARTFRIVLTDLGQMVFLPKLLEFIGREAPKVNIHVVQVPPSRLDGVAFETGDVDLAVGYFAEFDAAIRQQVLFEEHYVGIVRRDHPAIRDTLSFAQFLATPQLVYQPSGVGHAPQDDVVDRAFFSAGVGRRVAVRVAHSMGISSIVSNTDLLIVVPQSLAIACGELIDVSVLDLPIQLPGFVIAQYWHERFDAEPGNRWLRSAFARLYARARR